MTRRPWVEATAWMISVALHASLGGYIAWSTSTPDTGFEFSLPDEVEFGLTDAVTVIEGASAPSAASDPSRSNPAGEGVGASLDGGVPPDGSVDGGDADAGVDGGVPDAGRPRRRDAGRPEVAENDSEEDGTGAGDEGAGEGDEGTEGRGVAFLPAGSQIALRIDIARIRRSPLSPEVRALLAVLPDWEALIAGSDIDPLDDLDRLLVASPNLQRSRLIVAGRSTGDVVMIRAAAARLAASAGESIEWRTEHGVEVTEWHDRDPTERVIALIGPAHFVIARPEDLPRVLAVARNRAEDEDVHPADALLSMEEGEGLSLEVEGFRNFAQARPGRRASLDVIPTRVRISLTEQAEARVHFGGRMTFDDEAQARGATTHWEPIIDAYSRNIIVQMLGVAPLLTGLDIQPEEREVVANTSMTTAELSRLLGLGRGYFADRARTTGPGTAGPGMPVLPAPRAPVPGGAAPGGAAPGGAAPGGAVPVGAGPAGVPAPGTPGGRSPFAPPAESPARLPSP